MRKIYGWKFNAIAIQWDIKASFDLAKNGNIQK